MKIVSGFSRISEIEPLIKAGASELFCGTISEYRLINHREERISNLKPAELINAVRKAHSFRKKVYLAINEKGYSGQAIEYIVKFTKFATLAGIDGVIVADIMLLQIFKALNIQTKVILSCLNPCFNSESVRFNRQFGVSRIIFPRHITPHELKSAISGQNIEAEVFFNATGFCHNEDSFCKMHKPPGTCHSYKDMVIIDGPRNKETLLKRNLRKMLFPDPFSTLYDFHKMNIGFVKLAQRSYGSFYKIEITNFTRQILDILDTGCLAKDKFLAVALKLWKEKKF